jgi:hypothetical protein
MENDHEHPEARLGWAQEYYAHAVRIGDATVAREAEEALTAAKKAIAAEYGLSDDDRATLDRNIQALRQRLAERTERVPGAAVVQGAHLYSEPEIGDLAAAALEVGETSHAIGRVAAVGRRAVLENGRVQLEALGEEFAQKLAEIEDELARTRVDLDSAVTDQRESSREGVQPPGFGVGRLGVIGGWPVGLVLLALVASLAQFEIARIGFDTTFTTLTSALVAFGYVVTLGVTAGLVGRLFASSLRRFVGSVVWVIAIALLSTPPIFLSALDAEASGMRAAADIVVAFVGLLFVVLSTATGYLRGYRERWHTDYFETMKLNELRTRERHASLQAQRVSLLHIYVARGATMLAETHRLDAIYVHQTLQRAPNLSEDLPWEVEDLPSPRWLRDACNELDSVRP